MYHDPNAQIAGDAYLGYCAAKDLWYYGLKVHVVVTASGRPVEVLPLCGCSADLIGLQEMTLDLPAGAHLYGDKAYTDYDYEAALQRERKLTLLPLRKGNSKRPHAPELAAHISQVRKRIETTFSQVTAKFARRIAAVTDAGFESKIMAAFVAYAILGWQVESDSMRSIVLCARRVRLSAKGTGAVPGGVSRCRYATALPFLIDKSIKHGTLKYEPTYLSP